MRKKRYRKVHLRILSIAISAIAMTSCNNFEYHPYAKGIDGDTQTHQINIPRIEQESRGQDTVCFAFITDTQGWNDEMKDAISYIKTRKDVKFIVHGGDQSDFGLVKEFEWCRDMLQESGLPYVAIIGNHDCLGTGEHTFESIYGDPNYSFNAAHVHFTCLNTVAMEYDYSHPIPDFTFIEKDIDSVNHINANHPDSLRSTIVVMHAPPFDEQFNNNVAKPFQEYIRNYPGGREGDPKYPDDAEDSRSLSFRNEICIYGHIHSTGIVDKFGDGLLYYSCANVGKRTILIFKIYQNGYDCETIHF